MTAVLVNEMLPGSKQRKSKAPVPVTIETIMSNERDLMKDVKSLRSDPVV